MLTTPDDWPTPDRVGEVNAAAGAERAVACVPHRGSGFTVSRTAWGEDPRSVHGRATCLTVPGRIFVSSGKCCTRCYVFSPRGTACGNNLEMLVAEVSPLTVVAVAGPVVVQLWNHPQDPCNSRRIPVPPPASMDGPVTSEPWKTADTTRRIKMVSQDRPRKSPQSATGCSR